MLSSVLCVRACVCVCAIHPEGLIETVVLVLVRKSLVLWMEGYNLNATQQTTGNSSNKHHQARSLRQILYQHCAHGHTGDFCFLQQTFRKWAAQHTHTQTHRHTHTGPQECVHDCAWLSTQRQATRTHYASHTNTHVNMHTSAPHEGLTMKTLN